jgi:hypothetical protein
MGTIIRFLRTHPWYRRLLTVSVTIVVAMLAALLTYPYFKELLVLRDLGSTDEVAREIAIYRAAGIAQSSPRFLRRLNAALETAGDEKFPAIAEALQKIGKFDVPERRGVDIDRLRAHEMAAAPEALDWAHAALKREDILRQAVFDRRDNQYVRRIVGLGAGDEGPGVRRRAAVLAAAVGDDATLSKLLSDQDADVVSAAALCAGIAGRKALGEGLYGLLAGSDVEKVSSAAYAAAAIDPENSSRRICDILARTSDAAIRDRLLHVASLLDDGRSRRAVMDVLAASRTGGRFPPAMAILAASRMKLDAAESSQLVVVVRDALAGRGKESLRADVAMAAIIAAERLDIDVLKELIELCERAPRPYEAQFVWVPAARLIGRQAGRLGRDDPLRGRLALVLKSLAGYYDPKVTGPPDVLTMPVASASAAVAAWKLQAGEAEEDLRKVARCGGRSAVDYLTWHLGLGGGPGVGELAFRMLPPCGAPVEQKVFNEDERAAGAMLMAFSARTPQEKSAAAERITERLIGGRGGGEYEPRVVDACHCALLILGQKEMLPKVRHKFEMLPQRRELAALLVAGDVWALDHMLWGHLRDDDIDFILADEGAWEVLAAAAPDLPRIDAAAGPAVRRWQLRIMQCYYGLNRQKIHWGWEDEAAGLCECGRKGL